MKISKVVVVINRTKSHAKQTGAALKAVLDREGVRQQWIGTLPPQRNFYRRLRDLRAIKADLVIACGGDGTLLHAAHRIPGSGLPLLAIHIGDLGFITSNAVTRAGRQMRHTPLYGYALS